MKEIYTNKWNTLICNKRNAHANEQKQDGLRSPYLIDVDRVIYSSHFRKLQDKTQVHPLSKSDYVRTRLTHSLEVAGVGRSLGYSIGQYIINKYNLTNLSEHDFGYILQGACLAHDIGNPPFGHLGEEAIQAFFLEHKNTICNEVSIEEFNNLASFDGNSQGFRIITNLAGWKEEGGLRLTYATLGSFLKYPRLFTAEANITKIQNNYSASKVVGTAKVGVFATEEAIFHTLASELNLIALDTKENNVNKIFFRHPLAFLTEAADDICYSIADVEDAFFVDIASLKEVEKLLAPIARSPKKYEGDSKQRTTDLRKETFYKQLDERKKVEWLRGKAINNLTLEVIDSFTKNEEDILSGKFNNEILKTTVFANEIEACKDFAKNQIFNSHDKINSEIKGIEAINGVLEELYKVIIYPKHPKSRRIKNLLKGKILETGSTYEKLVSIVDIVADFTDRNILDIHKVLKGVE